MKLFKQTSKRINPKDNKPYTDLYLGWVYEGKAQVVRIHHAFACDFQKLLAQAQSVPSDEPVEKYL